MLRLWGVAALVLVLFQVRAIAQDRYPQIEDLWLRLSVENKETFDVSSPPGSWDFGFGHIQGMARLPDGEYVLSHDNSLGADYLMVDDGVTLQPYHVEPSTVMGAVTSCGSWLIYPGADRPDSENYANIRERRSGSLTANRGPLEGVRQDHHSTAMVYHPIYERYFVVGDSHLYMSASSDPLGDFDNLGGGVTSRYTSSNAETGLLYDVNFPRRLYVVGLERIARQSGIHNHVEKAVLSRIDFVYSGGQELPTGFTISEVFETYLPDSSYFGGIADAGSGFRWGGGIHINQYEGMAEIFAAPRNLTAVPSFHRWTTNVAVPSYAGSEDRVYILGYSRLYELDSEAANSVVTIPTSASIPDYPDGAAVCDDVIYWVSNGSMRRHPIYPEIQLPSLSNQDDWAGFQCMAAPEAPYPQQLWVIRNGSLYAMQQDGSRSVQGPAGLWSNVSAMVFADDELFALDGGDLVRINPNRAPHRVVVGSPGRWSSTYRGGAGLTSVRGKIYISADGELHEVHTNNGSVRILDNDHGFPGGGASYALGKTPGGMLLALDFPIGVGGNPFPGGTLYRVDPDSGGRRRISGDWTWQSRRFLLNPTHRVRVRVEGSFTPNARNHLRAHVYPSVSGKQYQWYFNGFEIQGATTRDLIIDNFSCQYEGGYHCVVTGLPYSGDDGDRSNTLQLHFTPPGSVSNLGGRCGTAGAVSACGQLRVGGSADIRQRLGPLDRQSTFLAVSGGSPQIFQCGNGCKVLFPQILMPSRLGGSGDAWASLSIPGDASLAGAQFTVQWITLTPGVNPCGVAEVSNTDILRCTIAR